MDYNIYMILFANYILYMKLINLYYIYKIICKLYYVYLFEQIIFDKEMMCKFYLYYI